MQSEDVTKTTSYKPASTMSDSDKAIYEYTAEYPVIAHLLFSATGSATYQLENITFTRIEGTLYIPFSKCTLHGHLVQGFRPLSALFPAC